MLCDAVPVLITACGMTLVIICRQIDISIASQFALCSVFAGLAASNGWPMPVVGIAAVLCGGRSWVPSTEPWLRSSASLHRGDPRHHGHVARGIALVARGRVRPAIFRTLSNGSVSGSRQTIHHHFYRCPSLPLSSHLPQRTSPPGASFMPSALDKEAARLAGIHPQKVTFAVFVLMGALTGLAALLNAVRFPDVDPKAGQGLELKAIAAAVVGGVAISAGEDISGGRSRRPSPLSSIAPAWSSCISNPNGRKRCKVWSSLLGVAADGWRSVRKKL